MYLLLLIVFVGIVLTWFLLRRFTHIWIRKPLTAAESLLAGTSAWGFLFSALAWFIGIIGICIRFFLTHDFFDVGGVLVCLLFTGYVISFFSRSRSEMQMDDTWDFFKEAIQFRRSAQRRLDIISLMRSRQFHRPAAPQENLRRERLQSDLSKEKELQAHLSLLRQGTSIDLSEEWRIRKPAQFPLPLFEKIQEIKIDPERKRITLSADFPELDESMLTDETTVLRLNRQIFDLFHSLCVDPWLRPFVLYYDRIFLLCRARKQHPQGDSQMYPFLKASVYIADVRKYEGAYFNPRKLGELADLNFRNGAQV